MSLEQAVEKLTARFDALIAILAAENAPAITAPAAETEQPKKRAKKEAAPEAPAGESAPSEATAPSPETGAADAPAMEDAAPATEPPTYADAAAAVTRVVKELGTPRAKELLLTFNAGNLKEVDPKHYAEVIAAAEAMLFGANIPF